ncbi:MAG: hypothetical protein WCW56_01445 [Candidatus Paceibacterota bacterium]|jgi:hypothetical protein
MITKIIITAVLTFIITSLWAKYSYSKGHKNLDICFKGLVNDLNQMSKELGFKDIEDYWTNKKGEEYSKRGIANIENSIDWLKDS